MNVDNLYSDIELSAIACMGTLDSYQQWQNQQATSCVEHYANNKRPYIENEKRLKEFRRQ